MSNKGHKLSDYVKPRKKIKRGAWGFFTTWNPDITNKERLERIYKVNPNAHIYRNT
jgi:hypothetical protein